MVEYALVVAVFVVATVAGVGILLQSGRGAAEREGDAIGSPRTFDTWPRTSTTSGGGGAPTSTTASTSTTSTTSSTTSTTAAPTTTTTAPVVLGTETDIYNDWGSGYCAEVTVTTTSPTPVDWTAEIDMTRYPLNGQPSNIWNGDGGRDGGTLVVTNGGRSWNRTSSTGPATFGFCAERPAPEVSRDVRVQTRVTDDWGSGFCVEVTISSSSTRATGWQVELDLSEYPLDGEPYDVWNTDWVSDEGRMIASGTTWDRTVAVGDPYRWGFCARRPSEPDGEDLWAVSRFLQNRIRAWSADHPGESLPGNVGRAFDALGLDGADFADRGLVTYKPGGSNDGNRLRLTSDPGYRFCVFRQHPGRGWEWGVHRNVDWWENGGVWESGNGYPLDPASLRLIENTNDAKRSCGAEEEWEAPDQA